MTVAKKQGELAATPEATVSQLTPTPPPYQLTGGKTTAVSFRVSWRVCLLPQRSRRYGSSCFRERETRSTERPAHLTVFTRAMRATTALIGRNPAHYHPRMRKIKLTCQLRTRMRRSYQNFVPFQPNGNGRKNQAIQRSNAPTRKQKVVRSIEEEEVSLAGGKIKGSCLPSSPEFSH